MKPFGIILATITVGLLVVLILSAIVVYGYYAYFQSSGRIASGVHVLDMPLGGMTVADAAVAIQKTWNIDHRITVSDGVIVKIIPPGILGLSADPLLTVRDAYQIGRRGDLFLDLETIIASHKEGITITPVVILDEDAALAGFEHLEPFFSQAPKNATVMLEGSQLVPVEGEPGYTINREDTLKAIAANPYSAMLAGSAPILLKPVPPPVEDVSAVIHQAQELLDTDFSINAYDPITNEHTSWSPTREDISQWLIIEQGDLGPQVKLDSNQLRDYLQAISDSIGPERRIDVGKYGDQLDNDFQTKKSTSILINHNATAYRVQSGDTLLKIGWKLGFPFSKILEANPDLDPDNLLAGSELLIPSKDDLLPLPVIPGKRIVISISKQRLMVYEDGKQIGKHLISTGIDRSPTQPGVFQVQSHERNAYASVWELTMPHFLGIYEAWPGFMNGIHGLPTLDNGSTLWANILGRPASYGCIILDSDTAAWLYNWAEDGVVVEILP